MRSLSDIARTNQTAFAAAIGVSVSHVCHLLAGRTRLSTKRLALAAAKFDASGEEVVAWLRELHPCVFASARVDAALSGSLSPLALSAAEFDAYVAELERRRSAA